MVHSLRHWRSKSTIAEPQKATIIDSFPVEDPVPSFDGCVVNSHNEFDPLEEVIVGCVKDATIPEYHVSGKAVWPSRYWDMYKTSSGQPFPADLMKNAAIELDNFAKILQAEGVTVRRPGTSILPICVTALHFFLDHNLIISPSFHVSITTAITFPRSPLSPPPDIQAGDFSQPFNTPDFKAECGLYAAMPRDILSVFGNEIIEAPMAWRSRFFEYRPYRGLIKDYFKQVSVAITHTLSSLFLYLGSLQW